MSALPEGVKGDELASSKGAPSPHLTLSPRSMSSDEPDVADENHHETENASPETVRGLGYSSSEQQHPPAPPQTRGRSTTMHQSPASPNARSKSVTVADGNDTQGMINRHPANANTFTVGVASDKNKKCRRTMEDAHAFVYDYGGIPGQGYFAVFDGHAGKHAAEWCGQHFHEYLLAELERQPDLTVPDIFNTTFHKVDSELSSLAATQNTHSGCTAVTAFLRVEDPNGKPPTDSQLVPLASIDSSSDAALSAQESNTGEASSSSSSNSNQGGTSSPRSSIRDKRRSSGGSSREKIMSFITRNTTRSRRESSSAGGKNAQSAEQEQAYSKIGLRRVLYTANVGDARAVICRNGRAVRLTYDHKGSDQQEAKRITDAGGFVMNHRVNGILAVTRSLGDSSMKEFVVGSPYTTETVIGPNDDWLIVACDGLWDVCEDQEAADLLCKSGINDAQEGAESLLEFALSRFSSDNISVLVVKL